MIETRQEEPSQSRDPHDEGITEERVMCAISSCRVRQMKSHQHREDKNTANTHIDAYPWVLTGKKAERRSAAFNSGTGSEVQLWHKFLQKQSVEFDLHACKVPFPISLSRGNL